MTGIVCSSPFFKTGGGLWVAHFKARPAILGIAKTCVADGNPSESKRRWAHF
jgi:hypothetical protein